MTKILGKSIATAEQMAAHLLSKNPNPKIKMDPVAFCRLFLYMAALEGVRGDLLFAQSCKETGYFNFNGTVTEDQNNYAGIGTTDATTKGAYFPDEATGILAQAQHAKGYATADALVYECVDPRYALMKKGSAPNWEDLGGKWAVPGYDTKKYSSLAAANDAEDSYGYQILSIYKKMIGSEEEKKEEQAEKETTALPLAGRKICIDPGHYAKYNRSPGVPEYYESEVMWKLHLLQKKYLEELGAKVIATRANKNNDMGLQARGQAAKGCDAFISDHSNAVGSGMNESIDYVAVYHLTEDAFAVCDEISGEIAKALAPVISGVMGTKQGHKVLTRKASSDRNGDGVLNDNYYGVLHGARTVDVPGLILEHSFHTNTAMTKWLLKDDNLNKLAKAEAEAIAAYFSGKKVVIDSSTSGVPYAIRVANVSKGNVLNIRKEPSASEAITGSLAYNDPNRYTIVEERNGWGRLKSGIGWINLKYTVRE